MRRRGFKWPRCSCCGLATYVCSKRGCPPRPATKEKPMPETAPAPARPQPVLVLKAGTDHTTEVYLLNPGQHFPGFGGSSRGLTVVKTASLIIRQRSTWSTSDYEYDLADAKQWAWLARRLADGTFTVDTSAAPVDDDEG